MKILAIPDIHQHLEALDYIRENYIDSNKGDADKIVFLGDLVDDWKSDELWFDKKQNPVKMIENLSDIKDKLGDRFIWLLGNHDLSYLPSVSYYSHEVSGHQWKHTTEITQAFVKILSKIQICTKIDGVVYSHAGFTKRWMNHARKLIKDHADVFTNPDDTFQCFNETLSDKLAESQLYNDFFDHRGNSPSGDDIVEGPLWVRPTSVLISNNFSKQVVGHTELKSKQIFKDGKNLLAVIDSREHNNFVTITDGDMESIGFEVHEISPEEIKMEKLRRRRLSENPFAFL